MATLQPLGSLLCRRTARGTPDRLSYLHPSSVHRRRLPSISCKHRKKAGGSSPRRRHIKKSPPEKSPLDPNLCTNAIMPDVQMIAPDIISNSHTQATTNDDVFEKNADIADGPDFKDIIPIGEKRMAMVNRADVVDHFPSHLEDLITMIKNAEKNVLLLNEARLQALKELDKVHAEKEILQAQVRSLMTKLPESDEHIITNLQEKRCSFLGLSSLEELMEDGSPSKVRDFEPNIHVNGNKSNSSKVPASCANGFVFLEDELNVLMEENILHKDSIRKLEAELADLKVTSEHAVSLEKERSMLEYLVRDLEHKLAEAQKDASELPILKTECNTLTRKVECLHSLLASATEKAEQAAAVVLQNDVLLSKIKALEASLEETKAENSVSEKIQHNNDFLQQKVKILEDLLERSEEEINSHIQLYEAAVKEFQDTLDHLKEESKRRASKATASAVPDGFWSSLLLMVDSWLLENKICARDATLLRKLIWKRDIRIRDTYLESNDEIFPILLKLASSPSSGLNVVQITTELTPVVKVGGLGDFVCGLSKALQKKGHLVEIVLPKYDSMLCEHVNDLKMLDVEIQSYFNGQFFANRIWTGTVEGLPVHFIEPQHPAKFFLRGTIYGESDDFKRFSYFSRAALELLYKAGKKPDIIHCHDWHTAFVAPLYWENYVVKGFNSARVCFTCHNFGYQGSSPASELTACGLDANRLNRQDRMQDSSSFDMINPVKGAIVFSNIVTTVSPTYAKEMKTAERGRGLQETLKFHSKKFSGILNGLDTDTWNPSTDTYLQFQYGANALHGKVENKEVLRKLIKLSDISSKPLVGCITKLVLQKDVHLIRYAIYQAMELGSQFVLVGTSSSSPIRTELENLAYQFRSHPNARVIINCDESLVHLIYAASDMLLIPSISEPCDLPQVIAIRYGSVPITRTTDGVCDRVFDMDDTTIPVHLRNGFTFGAPDEKGIRDAMKRAYERYTSNPESWQELVQKNMRTDLSWDAPSAQYEQLYQKAVARASSLS